MADVLPSPSVSGIKGYFFFALKVTLALAAFNWAVKLLVGTSVLEFIERPKEAFQNLKDRFVG